MKELDPDQYEQIWNKKELIQAYQLYKQSRQTCRQIRDQIAELNKQLTAAQRVSELARGTYNKVWRETYKVLNPELQATEAVRNKLNLEISRSYQKAADAFKKALKEVEDEENAARPVAESQPGDQGPEQTP